MNSTEPADRFFSAVILTLRRLNERFGESYFALAPDESRATYWEPVSTRTGGIGQVTAGVDLMQELVSYWGNRGETRLARAAEDIFRLADELGAERKSDEPERLSDFVYPLF